MAAMRKIPRIGLALPKPELALLLLVFLVAITRYLRMIFFSCCGRETLATTGSSQLPVTLYS